jgi:hypothetical protein
MAKGGGQLSKLSDLQGPMSAILGNLAQQLTELARYKAMYGELGSDNRDDYDSEGSDATAS